MIPSMHELARFFGRLLRLWPAWVVTLGLLMIVYAVARAQIPVTLYKAMMVTLGGIIGFWFHVWSFGHIGESQTEGVAEREKDRRALLIVGGMIALALAV